MFIKTIHKNTILCAFLAILVTVFIFANSLNPAVESDELSTGLLEKILTLLSSWGLSGLFGWLNSHSIRKLAHFLEFFSQAFFILCALACEKKWNPKIAGLVLLCGFLTACTDETIQLFVPGRSGQISDVLLDTSGCAFAILCRQTAVYLYKKIQHKPTGGTL